MRFLIAGCTAMVLAATLAAQNPPTPAKPQAPQQPTFKAGVSFVRVDVYPSLNGQIVPDLQQNEFEVLEDGVPQRIETFDHIVARAPGTPSEGVMEPRSQEESNEMAADPRNRLFVLFFDTLHTAGYLGNKVGGYDPAALGRALAVFLEKLIGPDDLIGVMRPEMSVEVLAFTRRPSSFAEFLMSGGEWQKRFLQGEMDETERKYETCYMIPEEGDIAPKMIVRRRELLAIDGIRSLIVHLENLREGRKAVIVVSEGWTLFTPDKSLARPLRNQMPGGKQVGIVGGQPTLGGDNNPHTIARTECERDRIMLAGIDDDKEFRRILDEANRANVSFYTLSPAGLTTNVFERRSEALASLATATDGLALENSNDFAPGLKRIADDVASYYLLGYNSTNSKFDGKFRAITVRVKRPGVTVRARRGYVAPTEAEVAARAKAEAAGDPEEEVRRKALGSLGTERPDHPFRIIAGHGFDAAAPGAQPGRPTLWLIGELDAAVARTMEWSGGGEATIVVTGADGRAVATEHATITAAAPRFITQLADAAMKAGDYLVKVRLQGKSGSATDATAQMRVTVPEARAGDVSGLGQPMLFRRGQYTGAGYQPTADLRFRKAERVRVDVPVIVPADSVTAQLLDRKGQTLLIPVTIGQRDDGGRHFVTAEVALAPLAPADYLIEVSVHRGARTDKMVAALRIIP